MKNTQETGYSGCSWGGDSEAAGMGHEGDLILGYTPLGSYEFWISDHVYTSYIFSHTESKIKSSF